MHTEPPATGRGLEELGTDTSFWSVIEGRRTVRFYTDEAISEEHSDALLRAAVVAPSGHNAQPWRFVVLRDVARREKLMDAMAGLWERDLRRSGVEEKIINAEIKFSKARFVTAPLLLLPCLTMDEMDHYPDPRRRKAEHAMAIQSVAAAIQNLLLAAHALGLGACWTCAPLFCQALVRRTLALPRSWEPQAFMTVGYPRHDPPVPPRKPFEDLVHVL